MLFLCGIGIKVAKKEPLVSVNDVLITPEAGMEGDVRGVGKPNRSRQVTIISMNQWREVCADMGWNPFRTSWMIRRAGLCIEGVWFGEEHLYHRHYIHIGDEVVLEITTANPPCERMNTIAPGFMGVRAVGLRAGVACRVIRGGRIATGNNVVISRGHES